LLSGFLFITGRVFYQEKIEEMVRGQGAFMPAAMASRVIAGRKKHPAVWPFGMPLKKII